MGKDKVEKEQAIAKIYAKHADDYDITGIYDQGFSVGTDVDQAVKDAEKTAKDKDMTGGKVVGSEYFQTLEHEANGEFVIRVFVGKDKVS